MAFKERTHGQKSLAWFVIGFNIEFLYVSHPIFDYSTVQILKMENRAPVSETDCNTGWLKLKTGVGPA